MKILTVEHQGQATAAVLLDGEVVLLDKAMRHVLADAPDNYTSLQASLDSQAFRSVALADVTVLAPVPDPGKIFCLAGNYADHILEGGGTIDVLKTIPDVFLKPINSVRGPNDAIVLSKMSRQPDWELELAIVIGKQGKYVLAAEAHKHVAGYMAFNDLSERNLIVWDEAVKGNESPRRAFFRWLNGKWLDGSAITGPWLVTPDEVGDPHALELLLDLNGEAMQRGNTGQMLLKIAQIVEFISHVATLEPGDVIATGTPAGVGAARNRFLQPGDEIRSEITSLGVQHNIVTAECP